MNEQSDKIIDTSVWPTNAQDLLGFGVGQVAYIRPMQLMNKQLFAIHAADGTPLSVFDDEQAALAALAQNDLDPVKLH
jgi:hypothetical protein